MITIKDLITKIRTRLRDESEGEFRFRDSELLDALNSAYLDLNYQFKLNIKKYTKQVSPEDNVLQTSKMFLSFEKAYLNNAPLSFKAYDEKAKSLQISSFSDFQSLIILPKTAANGTLEVFVNESVKLEKESVLSSGDFLENALIFSVLISIFQIESNESNLQRVGFYENLYKKETDRLRALISGTKEARSFQTYFNY
ncbi:hypothetical protein DK613_06910 [Campylobacter upsaliensis]|nr:hypothetical protein [Campylobacter upsaliensis]